jgi:hypothetical protein
MGVEESLANPANLVRLRITLRIVLSSLPKNKKLLVYRRRKSSNRTKSSVPNYAAFTDFTVRATTGMEAGFGEGETRKIL